MAEITVVSNVKIDVSNATKSLATLKKELKAAKKELENTAFGADGFKEKMDAVVAIEKEVKQFGAAMRTASKQTADSFIKVSSAADAQTKSLAQLKARQKELKRAFEQAKPGTEEYDRFQKELLEVTTAIRGVNASIRPTSKLTQTLEAGFDKTAKAMDGASKSAHRLSDAFVSGVAEAMTQIAFDALRQMGGVVKDSIQVFAEFSAQISKLGAISGASAEEMAVLEEQAKTLGSTTQFSASQVAELQIELAKLGFTADEIEKLTPAILNASAAMGSELGETAALVGATVRSFGLDAADAARVTDVLASSTTKTALDFRKLETGLAKVAPAAKASGVSIEETTALLGTLANNGIDASTAGSQLRNIFLTLSKRGMTMNQALEQINGSTNKNALAMELFGKQGATVALTLAANTGKTNELTEAFNNAGGAAQELAEKQMDNLQGDFKSLESAIEGAQIEIGEALEPALRSSTQTMTELVGMVGNAIKMFFEFTGSLGVGIGDLGLLAATLLLVGTRLGTLAKGLVQSVGGFFGVGKGASFASVGVKALGNAFKGLAIFAVIQAIMDLTETFSQLNAGARAAAEVQKDFSDRTIENNANIKQQSDELNNLFEELKKTNDGSSKRAALIAKINDEYGEYLPNQISEKDNLEDIEKAQKAANEQLTKSLQIKALADLYADYNKRLQESRVQTEQATASFRKAQGEVKNMNTGMQLLSVLGKLAGMDTGAARVFKFNAEMEAGKARTAEYEKTLKNLEGQLKELGAGIDGVTDKQRKLNEEEQKAKKLAEEKKNTAEDEKKRQQELDKALAAAIKAEDDRFAARKAMLEKALTERRKVIAKDLADGKITLETAQMQQADAENKFQEALSVEVLNHLNRRKAIADTFRKDQVKASAAVHAEELKQQRETDKKYIENMQKRNEEQKRLEKERADAKSAQFQGEIDNENRLFADQQLHRKMQRQEDFNALVDQLEAGEITKEQFDQRRADMEGQTRITELNAEITHLEKLREIRNKAGLDTTELSFQIAEKRMSLADQITQNEIANINERTAAEKDAQAKARKLTDARIEMAFAVGNALHAVASAIVENSNASGNALKALAIFEKGIGIAQAVVNTSVGASRALKDLPPPLSYIAVGTTIAIGAAQIAKIVATKIPTPQKAQDPKAPKMQQGGVLEGPSHARGGIPVMAGGRQVAEAEGGEVILTRGVTQNPQLFAMASRLNVMGGGIDFARTRTNFQMANGGIVVTESIRPDTNTELSAQLQALQRTVQELRPVVSVEEITDRQEDVQVLEEVNSLT